MGIFFSAQQIVWTEYITSEDARYVGVVSDPALGLALRKSRVFWKWMVEMFQPRNFTYAKYVPPTTASELGEENGKVKMDLPNMVFDYRLTQDNKFMFFFSSFDLTRIPFRARTAQYKDMIQTLVKKFVDTYVDAHRSFAAVREAGNYPLALSIAAENQLPTVIREVGDRPLDPMTAGPRRFLRVEGQGVDHVRQLTREMRRRFEE
jgi:hypothetical protein